MRTLYAFLFLSAATLGLVGCANKTAATASNDVPQMSSACSGDPYLMKYNCSLDRVQQAAEKGDPDAEYALGYMYYYGINAVRDQDSARLWIDRAAQQDQPLAKRASNMMHDQTNYSAATSVKSKLVDATPLAQSKSSIQPAIAAKPAALAKAPSQIKPAPMVAAKPGNIIAMESDLLHQPKTKYTIQLMGSHHLAVVRTYIKRNHLDAQAQYYYAAFNDRKWYMLVFGQYNTVAEARLAINQLPKSIRKAHPWIKPNKAVQAEIKTRHLVS